MIATGDADAIVEPGRHLLAVIDQQTRVVLGEIAVAGKTNELSASAPLLDTLTGIDLVGWRSPPTRCTPNAAMSSTCTGTAPGDGEPASAYRFNGIRIDRGSGEYDMGFRDYAPGLNRFLTRDSYDGALSDLGLAADPYTGNRYAFASGNPISRIELDGHCWGPDLVCDVAGGIVDVVTAPVSSVDGR